MFIVLNWHFSRERIRSNVGMAIMRIPCGKNTVRPWFFALMIFACFTAAVPLYAGTNQWIGIGPAGADVRALAVDPLTATTIYAATAAGVFKSADAGGSWSAANTGLSAGDVRALAIDPLTPATLYAGTATDGVFKSIDGGGSWSAANSGLTASDVRALDVDPLTPATLYAGTATGGIFRSVNGGGNWSAVNTGLTDTNVQALILDPLTPATVYAGTATGGVFKSVDGGGSWNNALIAADVRALALDPLAPATVYAGTATGGVFKSANGGGSWSAVNTGLSDIAVQALVLDPLNPATVYAGTATGGVFMSSDGGGAWSTVNSGLSNTTIRSLAIGKTATATVYAGTPADGAFKITTAPDIAISPVAFDFGSVTVGTPSSGQGFTLTNTGLADLTVNAIDASGGDSAMFGVAPGSCPSLTPTLKAGESCTVNITFTPALSGAKGTTLVVASNAVTTPSPTVPLTGTGVQPTYPLTITTAGTGNGVVNYQIEAISGSCSGNCGFFFERGTVISLTAVPDSNFNFDGWAGCNMGIHGTYNCSLILFGPLSVTAFFNLIPVDVPLYPSLQSAYNAAPDLGVIRATAVVLTGGLTCNRPVAVTLQGGYDTNFTVVEGYTLLNGSLTVSDGTLTVDRLVIM